LLTQKVNKPKSITEEEKNKVLALRPEEITLEKLQELFANTKNHNALFHTNDRFMLNKDILNNPSRQSTTVGKYIFNLFILKDLEDRKLIEYQNQAFDDDNISDLSNVLSTMFLERKIEAKDFMNFLDKLHWLGFAPSYFLNASLCYDLIVPPKQTQQLKKELIEKNKKNFESGDIEAASKVEKELLDDAKSRVLEVPDYQIYASGARGSWKNNFKNNSLMRGAIKNLAHPDQIHISTASLEDGIPPEEIAYYADLITQASYQRAVGTREGGYEYKKLSSGMSSAVLDEPGSDCGSHKTLELILTEKNYKSFMYRYIIEKGKLILLTSDNIKNYINKLVHMRSPMYCLDKEKYCSKCFGELYYLEGIRTTGLLSGRIGTSLLNAALKSFHDMTLKLTKINIDDYIQ